MFNEKCTFKKIDEDLKQAEKYLIFAKLAFKEYEKALHYNDELKNNVSETHLRKMECVLEQGLDNACDRLSGIYHHQRWIIKTDTVYISLCCVNCTDCAIEPDDMTDFCHVRGVVHHDEVMKRLEEAMKCFKTLVEASKVGQYPFYHQRIVEWEEEGFK